MRTTPVVSLDIHFGGTSEPGWHNVQASNNQTYGYRYTGGDDGAGGLVAVVGNGQLRGVVRLIAPKRYGISECLFADDPNRQLEWKGESPNAGAIIDKNSEVLTAKYTILVTDSHNKNCTIPCDPMVINRPPAID